MKQKIVAKTREKVKKSAYKLEEESCVKLPLKSQENIKFITIKTIVSST